MAFYQVKDVSDPNEATGLGYFSTQELALEFIETLIEVDFEKLESGEALDFEDPTYAIFEIETDVADPYDRYANDDWIKVVYTSD